MSKLNEIKEEYTSTSLIRSLVSTYQEIASMRMRSIRSTVLNNRNFMSNLNEVYNLTKYSYEREYKKLSNQNKLQKLINPKEESLIYETNGKTVCVLLSANSTLYGGLIRETFNKFLNKVKDNNYDIFITGKVGKRMYDNSDLNKIYTFFDISDDDESTQNIPQLAESIIKYKTVIVFHGKYESVIIQNPEETNVSGVSSLENMSETQKNIRLIFEPTLQDVFTFFEKEVIKANFVQTIHESNLSKNASRMISLDKSLENIDEYLGKVNLKRQRIRHDIATREQLATLSGLQLWKK